MEQVFGYLTLIGLDLEKSASSTFTLPSVPLASARARAAEEPRFVLLPLIVNRGSIFGALQVECAEKPLELDVVFVSAVVDQLATAVERDAVDRSVRASEAKLAGIMSMAADAVITVDEQMQIVLYNEGAERIFGWTLSEVLGKPVEILLPARFADAHRRHLEDFRASPDAARKMGASLPEIFGRRKDGAEFPAQAAISKIKIGGVWLFTVILRDISEQKQVERENTVLAEVSAVLGGTLDSEQTLGNVARLAMRESADFCVIDFLDERGELRRLEVVTFIPEKANIAVALKEYALDRSRPHLSSVILRENKPQIVARVSQAVRVAQRAVRVRDDVLGVVAHDLRNPLNSIVLQSELFRRRSGLVDRRSRKPGEVIERAARRMNRLIQDLLDVTSMEAGHLSIERACVPVRQLIADLLESQQPLATAHSLELRLDETATTLEVWADRERVFQVLENLVGNAAKFTPQGRPYRHRFAVARRERALLGH